MEANGRHVGHININACLPPRKRLLAGLKKHGCESSSSSSSRSSFPSDFGVHLREFLSINSKSPLITPEQIVEASRSAALAAAEVAAAAKATALEKAAASAKAAAAAKSALELVASVSKGSTGEEICLRRSKLKKHVPVKILYKGHQLIENHESDEELPCRLHQAINSSPRINKNSVTSDWKIHGSKTQRQLPSVGKTMVSNEGVACEGSLPPSFCDMDVESGDSAGYILEGGSSDKLEEDVDLFTTTKTNCFDVAKVLGEVEGRTKYSIKKYYHTFESRGVITGKKGRIKQKKLPLSVCSIRDREKHKGKTEFKGFSLPSYAVQP